MKIGIIGAGHIGGNLTRRLSALGHDVSVANSRGPDSLRDLTAETGARAALPQEAVDGADVVVVTVPMKSIPNLPRDLFANAPATLVVVDTGNYYPQRDGRIEAIEQGTTESRWTSQQLGRPVVKAFNNIYAQHLLEKGLPRETPGRIALPVAGDDKSAKTVVIALLDALGFDGVDAGSLDDSWRQQPGTPVYGADFDAAGVVRGLAEASKERKPQFTANADTSPSSAAPRRTSGGSGNGSVHTTAS
jgi:predicted dinucleotide-binding enzyme